MAGIGSCCFAIPGMRFSGVLCWCAVFALILLSALAHMAERRQWARWCVWALTALFGTGAVLILLLEAQVIAGSAADDKEQEVCCVLIPGAGVNGTEPSLILASRLDAALDYLSDKPGIPIIVSGCQGPGEGISEAECMALYLIQHGIDAGRIWKEEQASSTRTNFEYALRMMRERGIDSTKPFACVTSDFHVARSRYIASRQGIARFGMVCYGASLPGSAYNSALTMNYYIREAFALANEMLMGVDLDL